MNFISSVRIICIIFVGFNGLTESAIDEYQSCQLLYTFGYGYRQFFHLPLSSKLKNGSIILEFSVMASSDAHILLSPKSFPLETDPVYEIVLGAGRNSFSDIRRLRKAATRSTASTKYILSRHEMKKFWIRVNYINDGGTQKNEITVGDDNLSEPFLRWSDSNPLEINYMSFCTWTGVQGKWAYDCKGAKPVEANKSSIILLREYLLDEYDPYTMPHTDVNSLLIGSDITIKTLDLDLRDSSMKINAEVILSWFDPKLQWEHGHYGDISVFKISQREIWQPSLILFNGISPKEGPLHQGIIKVFYTGNVVWSTVLDIEVWCRNDITKITESEFPCPVKLGVQANGDAIQLLPPKNLAKNENRVFNRWNIKSIEVNSNKGELPWQTILNEDLPQHNETSVLTLTIYLQNNNTVLEYLLHIPLWISVLLSLIPLLLPPDCHERIYIHFIILMIFTLLLLSIDTNIPNLPQKASYMCELCGRLVLITAICLLLSVWLVHKSQTKEESSPPAILCSFIDLPIISSLVERQMIIETSCDESDKFFVTTSEQISTYWNIMIELLDRTLFIVVSCLYLWFIIF